MLEIKQFLYVFFLLCERYDINFNHMVFSKDGEIYRYEKNSSESFALHNNDDVTIIDVADYHYTSLDSFSKHMGGVEYSEADFSDVDYDDDDIDFC